MRPTRLILGLCLLLAACHKHVPIAALPPVAPPPPAPAPSPLTAPDKAFKAGSYDEAARGYEEYLRNNTAGSQRDQALFNLGLSYALRPAPATDWNRAAAALKEIMDEHPNSPYKQPAILILSLHAEVDQAIADNKQRDLKIKQLSTELDRLKKIDADRRRRP